MKHYIQTNDKGYVIGVTDTSDPIKGLFKDSQIYRAIADEQAPLISALLEEKHRKDTGLHINELEKILSKEKK